MGKENKKVKKEWKFHFLYRVINVENEKYYIGVHSTDNLDDGYLGSGTRLKKSIQYHGRKLHKREILEFFESREDAYNRESEVVNENLLEDHKCLNLSLGGIGLAKEEYARLFGKKGNESFKKRITEDEEFRKSFVEKAKESNKNNLRGFCKNPKDYGKTFEGHSHTEEVKRSIGEKNSLHQQGEKNSQFGTIWVNKEGANKKIKKEEKVNYLEKGWSLGINYEKFKRPEDKNILTKEKVLEIRGLLEKGISGRKVAADLNISRTSVEKIRRGESYSYY
jgi:hypothetical protein